jgi:hypothetical protein
MQWQDVVLIVILIFTAILLLLALMGYRRRV